MMSNDNVKTIDKIYITVNGYATTKEKSILEQVSQIQQQVKS